MAVFLRWNDLEAAASRSRCVLQVQESRAYEFGRGANRRDGG